MYPDLYKGLRLRPEDLASYDSPLVGFDGKTFVPKGMIKLPIQVGSRVVEVNFIVWILIPFILQFWQDRGFMLWKLCLQLCT